MGGDLGIDWKNLYFVGRYCQVYQGSLTSAVVAAGILLTMLGFGAWMAWMGLLWLQGACASGESVHLTQEQAEALRWTTSAEGKCDLNLMKWNSDSLTDQYFGQFFKAPVSFTGPAMPFLMLFFLLSSLNLTKEKIVHK